VGTPVREIYGVETVASGYTGNAIQEADFGAPAVPSTNIPPGTDTDTHEDARRNPPMQHQLWTFLTTGTVVDYCDGVCDPE